MWNYQCPGSRRTSGSNFRQSDNEGSSTAKRWAQIVYLDLTTGRLTQTLLTLFIKVYLLKTCIHTHVVRQTIDCSFQSKNAGITHDKTIKCSANETSSFTYQCEWRSHGMQRGVTPPINPRLIYSLSFFTATQLKKIVDHIAVVNFCSRRSWRKRTRAVTARSTNPSSLNISLHRVDVSSLSRRHLCKISLLL